MSLVFIGLLQRDDVPVPFSGEVECCEEDGLVSHVDITPPLVSAGWADSAVMEASGAVDELTRYSLEGREAAHRVDTLLRRSGYRAVSNNVARDRHLLRKMLGLIDVGCPVVLDLADVLKIAVITVFRDRPDLMPSVRVIAELISQSTEAERYRERDRGAAGDNANSTWWIWRDVGSRARILKMGISEM